MRARTHTVEMQINRIIKLGEIFLNNTWLHINKQRTSCAKIRELKTLDKILHKAELK